MKILIAPDKFKGSLSALEAAQAIHAGFSEAMPDVECDLCPIADGGEGTMDICIQALGGEVAHAGCMDALGRPIIARYGWFPQTKMAVIEMSEASGLWRIAPDDRSPIRSNTFGTGQLVQAALDRGAGTIVVGLGGSATNDGGVGLAAALGWKFLDADGNDICSTPKSSVRQSAGSAGASPENEEPRRVPAPHVQPVRCFPCPASLHEIVRIIPPAARPWNKMIALADVRNPLLGASGCSRCYSPQKGASSSDVDFLETALEKFATLCAKNLQTDFQDRAGAGAAGGTGFGLVAFCAAELVSGFDWLSRILDLEKRVAAADLVVTGEGTIDAQTLDGKAPGALAALARKHDKRVIAFCGTTTLEPTSPFDEVFSLADGASSVDNSIRNAASLLRERARGLGARLENIASD